MGDPALYRFLFTSGYMTKEEADAVAAKAMSLTTEAEVEAYLKSVAKH